MYLLYNICALMAGEIVCVSKLRRKKVNSISINFFVLLHMTMVLFFGISIPLVASGFEKIAFNSFSGAVGAFVSYKIMSCVNQDYRYDYWDSTVLAAPLMYGIGK